MVLAGLGLNPAGVLPFRNHALQSSLGAVPEPCSTEFLADEVATSTESTPGSERAKGVSEVGFHLSIFPWSSFIFFSESEHLSRSSGLDLGGCIIFCLRLHCIIFSFCFFTPPAGVSLFRMHAPQNSLAENPPTPPLQGERAKEVSEVWFHHSIFTEFLSDEGATSTEPVSKPVPCPAGVSLLVVASLHHLSFSLGRQKATLESFKGDGSGRFGLESCWGSAVSEPRSTELLSDEGATSTELLSKPVACPAGVSLLVVALLAFLCLWLHHLSFQ